METLTLHLHRHEALPPHERPTLVFRWPRLADTRRIRASLRHLSSIDQTATIEQADEAIGQVADLIRGLLVDWRNQTDERERPLAFDPDDLERIVDEPDLGELLGLLVAMPQHLRAEEDRQRRWQQQIAEQRERDAEAMTKD